VSLRPRVGLQVVPGTAEVDAVQADVQAGRGRRARGARKRRRRGPPRRRRPGGDNVAVQARVDGHVRRRREKRREVCARHRETKKRQKHLAICCSRSSFHFRVSTLSPQAPVQCPVPCAQLGDGWSRLRRAKCRHQTRQSTKRRKSEKRKQIKKLFRIKAKGN
jgi:hypothetical protein